MPALPKNMSEITLPVEPMEASFGDVIYKPGGKCGPRRQTQLQFFLLHAGTVDIYLDKKQCPALPVQHVRLLLPGHEEFYQFAPHSETHHSWCCLGFKSVPKKLRRLLGTLPSFLPMTRWMQSLVDLGVSIERSHPENRMLLIKMGEALFYEYAAAARRGGTEASGPWPEVLERAHQFIETNHAGPIRLEKLAKASGASVNHLIRLFRKHLHETPARYLWRYRTEQGLALLRNTGLSVSEIAYRVGFKTPFHFSRLVRQYQRASPRNLRGRGGEK